MKFALALIAAVSAVRIQSQAPGQCVDMEASDHYFTLVDTNGNGQISESELRLGVTVALDHFHYTPTKAMIKEFTAGAIKAAGADKQLNKKEFHALANGVAHQYAPGSCSA